MAIEIHSSRLQFVLLTATIVGLVFVGDMTVFAWNPPTQNPSIETGSLIVSGGNVGVGVANPAQKLDVAGVIESTSGGLRFPDGTTQSTSITGAGGVPSGYAILSFSNSSCPAGFTKLAGMDLRFSRADATAGDIGGSATHNHAMPHTHSLQNHTHTTTAVGLTADFHYYDHQHNLFNGTGAAGPGNGWGLVGNSWGYAGPSFFERPLSRTDYGGGCPQGPCPPIWFGHSHTIAPHDHGNVSAPSVANTGQPDTSNTADSNFQPLYVDAIVCVKN